MCIKMDKVSSEAMREILIEIIKRFPNCDYVTDVVVRVPKSNNSEFVFSIADTLEKLSVLHNRINTSRNSIEGDFDIEKARFHIANNDF